MVNLMQEMLLGNQFRIFQIKHILSTLLCTFFLMGAKWVSCLCSSFILISYGLSFSSIVVEKDSGRNLCWWWWPMLFGTLGSMYSVLKLENQMDHLLICFVIWSLSLSLSQYAHEVLFSACIQSLFRWTNFRLVCGFKGLAVVIYAHALALSSILC